MAAKFFFFHRAATFEEKDIFDSIWRLNYWFFVWDKSEIQESSFHEHVNCSHLSKIICGVLYLPISYFYFSRGVRHNFHTSSQGTNREMYLHH